MNNFADLNVFKVNNSQVQANNTAPVVMSPLLQNKLLADSLKQKDTVELQETKANDVAVQQSEPETVQTAIEENKEETLEAKEIITPPFLLKEETTTSQQDNTLQVAELQVQNPALSIDDIQKLDDALIEAKMQNGLIEKFANFLKNKTKIGLGSNKLDEIIESTKQGKSSLEEANEKIKEYRSKQENTRQVFGDILSITASAAAFFAFKNTCSKYINGIVNINKDMVVNKLSECVTPEKLKENFSPNSKMGKKIIDKIIDKFGTSEKILKAIDKFTSKKFISTIAIIPTMFIGSFVKKNVLKLNRIGTKQYSANTTDDMTPAEKKVTKRIAKKDKKNANFRNSISGAINGLMMPIVGLLGPLGAPIYLAGNILNRYFIANKEDAGNKNPANFIKNLKDSKEINIGAALISAIPLVKKGAYSAKLDKSINSAIEKLKNVQLQDIGGGKTTYALLEETVLANDAIASVLNGAQKTEDKIAQLRDTNIIALKFKQIQQQSLNAGFIKIDTTDDIVKALKENCPDTWTIEQASEKLRQVFGDKYQINHIIGSGTVAQTFIATEKSSGKQVCLKMIHQGLDKNVIEKHYQACLEMINDTCSKNNISDKEKENLVNTLKSIADGIKKEVDLNNEMEAASSLAKVTKQAKVVRPIEVKDGVYIMEKADGVSLKSLNDYLNLSRFNSVDNAKEKVAEYEGRLAQAKEEYTKTKDEFEQYMNDGDGVIFKDFSLDELFRQTDANGNYMYRKDRQLYIKAQEEYVKAQVKNGVRGYNAEHDFSKIYYKAEDLYDKCTRLPENINNIINDSYYADCKKMIKLVEQNPGLENLSTKEAQRMIDQYKNVIREQFSKIGKDGKIIHGDIHAGNIFVDIAQLKSGKEPNKIFTLIDTGNVLQQSSEQALRFLNLTKYIENADYDNIAKFALEGAALPSGMKYEDAYKYVSERLKQIFFEVKDGKAYKTNIIKNDTMIGITDTIMREKGIIPAATQGDLVKAKQSANNSAMETEKFYNSLFAGKLDKDLEKLDRDDIGGAIGVMLGNSAAMGKDKAISKAKNSFLDKLQERANLRHLSLKDRLKLKKGKGTPKSNSEEKMIYHLKQFKLKQADKAENILEDMLVEIF